VTPIGGLFGGPPKRPRADDRGLAEQAPALPRRLAAEAPSHRDRREAFNGARPESVPSHLGAVENPEAGKLGICCSGGGIRSAAFSLGALQTLGREEELRRAAYLAAVSGGSYIAAAISMVAKTGPRDSDRRALEQLPAFAPGSPEEQYLRNRCSYLAPTGSDKLYVAIRVVLGLLLNLALLSLPLIGLGLILTGLLYAPLLPELTGPSCQGGACAANLPSWFWISPLGLLAGAGLCGAATLLFRWRRELWERFFITWTTRLAIAAAALAAVLVGLPYLVDWLDHLAQPGSSVKPPIVETVGSIGAGFLALVAGVAAQVGRAVLSKGTAESAGKARKALGKAGSGIALALAYGAGALIGPLLLLAILALSVAVGMAEADGGRVEWVLAGIGVGALALSAGVYAVVDLTTWSLHPYYKRRLSTAFALKRVRELDDEERRRVETVAPVDPEQDVGIAIERDYDELLPLSRTALTETAPERGWPTLLVCAAANISDCGATPPGRRVTSFTFSAHTAGGPLVGAVRMRQLERAFENRAEAEEAEDARVCDERLGARLGSFVKAGARRQRRRDLTLPAVVAISGAAVSPSMGKMTPRPLTFLMALANLRLGVWVPNPRWVAETDEDTPLPRRFAKARASYLIRELLGRNRVDARYLYVTDGGHYENLGLVELLRRGCTEVYCLDASGVGGEGPELGALGDAIALARSELGVEIEFEPGRAGRDPGELSPDGESQRAKRDVVTATIRYPGKPGGEPGAEGKLVYVRNTMTAKAPLDVVAHHESDPRFPNNSTLDQLYTDQKFEAYRVLGERAAGRAVKAMESA
jgi:hypothetical protein